MSDDEPIDLPTLSDEDFRALVDSVKLSDEQVRALVESASEEPLSPLAIARRMAEDLGFARAVFAELAGLDPARFGNLPPL
jgi:hypothetical protein